MAGRIGSTWSGLRNPTIAPSAAGLLSVQATATAPGLLFITPSSGPGQRGVLIVDDEGEPIWFQDTPHRATTNFRVASYKGEPVLTWSQRPPIKTNGDLYTAPPHAQYDVIADTRYHVIRRLRVRGPGARTDLHDMVLFIARRLANACAGGTRRRGRSPRRRSWA